MRKKDTSLPWYFITENLLADNLMNENK